MKRILLAAVVLAGCGGLGSRDDGGYTSDAGPDDGFDAGTSECDPNKDQPDTCGYGRYCELAVCRDVQRGTCSNFPVGHETRTWDPLVDRGAVIYASVDEPVDVQADCASGANPFTVTLKAYLTQGTFPVNKSNLPGFIYLSSSGTPTDVPMALLRQENYSISRDGKNATFKLTLCSTTATSSLIAGFYFTGGNPYCVMLTH